MSEQTFTTNLSIADLRVGDHIEAWVNCGKGAQKKRTTWRGEVSEIQGNVIRFNVRWAKAPFITCRADIISAWGYRPSLAEPVVF
jgi:hypothetical protein